MLSLPQLELGKERAIRDRMLPPARELAVEDHPNDAQQENARLHNRESEADQISSATKIQEAKLQHPGFPCGPPPWY